MQGSPRRCAEGADANRLYAKTPKISFKLFFSVNYVSTVLFNQRFEKRLTYGLLWITCVHGQSYRVKCFKKGFKTYGPMDHMSGLSNRVCVRAQVGTNPKPKKRETEVPKSEELVPKSQLELLRETLPKLLSYSATSRTQSISLSNVEYAAELSKQLLSHAESVEELFKKVQKTVDSGAEDKVLGALLEEVKVKEAFQEKAKAGSANMGTLKLPNNQPKSLPQIHTMPIRATQTHRSPLSSVSSPCTAQAAASAFLKKKGKAKKKAGKGKAK